MQSKWRLLKWRLNLFFILPLSKQKCNRYLMSHFWIGSLCRCYSVVVGERKDSTELYFPSNVVGASDIIRIRKDLGNDIPDKSCMLCILELFDSCATNNNYSPIELNLICQFNECDNFWAIFEGINRNKFTHVTPIVGHSYLREIVTITQ
jgi:hypothetical protein